MSKVQTPAKRSNLQTPLLKPSKLNQGHKSSKMITYSPNTFQVASLGSKNEFKSDPLGREEPKVIENFLHGKTFEHEFQKYLDGKIDMIDFVNVKNFPNLLAKEKKRLTYYTQKTQQTPKEINLKKLGQHMDFDLNRISGFPSDQSHEIKIQNKNMKKIQDLLKFKIKMRRIKAREKKGQLNEKSSLNDFKLFDRFSGIIQGAMDKINQNDLLSQDLTQPYYFDNVKSYRSSLKTFTLLQKKFSYDESMTNHDIKHMKKEFLQCKSKHYPQIVKENFEKKAENYLTLLEPPRPDDLDSSNNKKIEKKNLNPSNIKCTAAHYNEIQKLQIAKSKTNLTESTQLYSPKSSIFFQQWH